MKHTAKQKGTLVAVLSAIQEFLDWTFDEANGRDRDRFKQRIVLLLIRSSLEVASKDSTRLDLVTHAQYLLDDVIKAYRLHTATGRLVGASMLLNYVVEDFGGISPAMDRLREKVQAKSKRSKVGAK